MNFKLKGSDCDLLEHNILAFSCRNWEKPQENLRIVSVLAKIHIRDQLNTSWELTTGVNLLGTWYSVIISHCQNSYQCNIFVHFVCLMIKRCLVAMCKLPCLWLLRETNMVMYCLFKCTKLILSLCCTCVSFTWTGETVNCLWWAPEPQQAVHLHWILLGPLLVLRKRFLQWVCTFCRFLWCIYTNAECKVFFYSCLIVYDWRMLNISAEAPVEAEVPTVHDYTDEQLQLLVR